jgi:hypothetical protein
MTEDTCKPNRLQIIKPMFPAKGGYMGFCVIIIMDSRTLSSFAPAQNIIKIQPWHKSEQKSGHYQILADEWHRFGMKQRTIRIPCIEQG